MLLCAAAETGPFPSAMRRDSSASDWLCTAAEWKSGMLFFFPIGVLPLASAPWQTVQPLFLKIEAPSAELAVGVAGWVSCRGEGAEAGGGTVVVAAVSVRTGEADDVVSVFDGSRAVREVVATFAGVVVVAGGAALATVDEESVTGRAVAVSETVDEVAVVSLGVEPLVVVVSLFWQAATSDTANATAMAVFADLMMFPPVRGPKSYGSLR